MENIPKKKEGYTVVQLENGELALANMEKNLVIKVDPVIIAVWLAVDGSRNIDEITRKIMKDYEIPEEEMPFEKLRDDIQNLVDLMVREGILEYVQA